jgi:hypothetical protein
VPATVDRTGLTLPITAGEHTYTVLRGKPGR